MSEVTIRRLAETDAAAIVDCFERCYGATYPSDHFHDPELLRERMSDGTLRSVGAIADGGTVVGHMGLWIRHRDAQATEAGNTVVAPAYRGLGLLGRLGEALAELCRAEGFIGYVHYPTTDLLPEFAHTDVLRLQRLESPSPDSFAPELANDDARELLAFITRDSGQPDPDSG